MRKDKGKAEAVAKARWRRLQTKDAHPLPCVCMVCFAVEWLAARDYEEGR